MRWTRSAMLASLLAVMLAALSAFAQKPPAKADPTDLSPLIQGVGGIEWRWGPRETLATLTTKGTPQPTVVWIGRIVDVRAGKSVAGEKESVVEFLAAYMPLVAPGAEALVSPVRLRPETGEHFVVSLRSPAATEEMLKNLRQSMLDTPHYTVVLGEPRGVAPFGRWVAIWLQTRRATVTQQLKFEIVTD